MRISHAYIISYEVSNSLSFLHNHVLNILKKNIVEVGKLSENHMKQLLMIKHKETLINVRIIDEICSIFMRQ
jgi:hypothetical protein